MMMRYLSSGIKIMAGAVGIYLLTYILTIYILRLNRDQYNSFDPKGIPLLIT
jgi:hypothetical protein